MYIFYISFLLISIFNTFFEKEHKSKETEGKFYYNFISPDNFS